MASLTKRPSGSWSIQFEDRDRRRRTLSVGRMSKRDAETIQANVEKLAAAQLAGSVADPAVNRWLATIGDKLRDKLETLGLVETQQGSTLGAFIDDFLAQRRTDPTYKPRTLASYRAPFESLRLHLGAAKPLRAIRRPDDAEWRQGIAYGRAENTVRKWTAKVKTLFNAALDAELIDRNPFDGLAATIVEARERDYFVSIEETAGVLAACPTTDWRMIFMLARFGGLRCPSEVLALR